MKRDPDAKRNLVFLSAAKKRLLRNLANGNPVHSDNLATVAGASACSILQLRNEMLEAELIECVSFRSPPGSFAIRISEKGRRSLAMQPEVVS